MLTLALPPTSGVAACRIREKPRRERSRRVEDRIFVGDRANVGAHLQQPVQKLQLRVEQDAVVQVEEAILFDLAAREVNLEAPFERQSLELTEQITSALAAQPLVREQVPRIERDSHFGFVRNHTEEVISVESADHEGHPVRKARKLDQERRIESRADLSRVRHRGREPRIGEKRRQWVGQGLAVQRPEPEIFVHPGEPVAMT